MGDVSLLGHLNFRSLLFIFLGYPRRLGGPGSIEAHVDMVIMAADMLKGRGSPVGKQLIQIARVHTLTERIFVQLPLDPAVQEDILDVLRAEKAVQEAPGLRRIEDFVVHGHKGVKRPVAFGIHSQIHIAAVLMRAVHVEPTAPSREKSPMNRSQVSG